MEDKRLVQPIVVLDSGTHETVVTCVTSVAYLAYQLRNNKHVVPFNYAWDAWLAGSFTKSVRLAKPKLFQKVRLEPNRIIVMTANYGDLDAVQVVAFGPMEEPFPKSIKRCQVSGLEMPRLGFKPIDKTQFIIAINPDVPMTTGKTAAQCAHAYMGHHILFPNLEEPRNVNITEDPEIFHTLMEDGKNKVEIKDAGLTEVEPGTLTVIAGFL